MPNSPPESKLHLAPPNTPPRPPLPPPPGGPPNDPPPPPSDDILRGRQEVAIRHNGRLYRLCRTRSGKLILT